MAAPEELRARTLHRGRHRRVNLRALYLKLLWKSDLKYVIANFWKTMACPKKGREEPDLCCWLLTRTDKISSVT